MIRKTVCVAFTAVVVPLLAVALLSGCAGHPKLGSNPSNPSGVAAIMLEPQELQPYVLARESRYGWPYAERGETVLLREAINQQVLVEGETFILITYCEFPSREDAVEAAMYYSTHMQGVFEQGGPEGRRFGESCWTGRTPGGFGAVLLQQGRYCVLVSSPWSGQTQRKAIVQMASSITAKIARIPQ